jgi:hypothetical protein
MLIADGKQFGIVDPIDQEIQPLIINIPEPRREGPLPVADDAIAVDSGTGAMVEGLSCVT